MSAHLNGFSVAEPICRNATESSAKEAGGAASRSPGIGRAVHLLPGGGWFKASLRNLW